MYNGIGLQTPRGSATSGHVTKNLSYIKPDFFRKKLDANTGRQEAISHLAASQAKSNDDILSHNRKREMEAKIFEMQESMLEQDFTDEEIEAKVAEFKQQFMAADKRGSAAKDFKKTGSSTDTHEINRRKELENERIKNAFGISSNFVEGAAFDPEIQEQRKKDRLQEREAKNQRYEEEGSIREARAREAEAAVEASRKQRIEQQAVGRQDNRDGDRYRGGERDDRRGDREDDRRSSRDYDRERDSRDSREPQSARDSRDNERYRDRSYQDSRDERRGDRYDRDRVRDFDRDRDRDRARYENDDREDRDRDRRRDQDSRGYTRESDRERGADRERDQDRGRESDRESDRDRRNSRLGGSGIDGSRFYDSSRHARKDTASKSRSRSRDRGVREETKDSKAPTVEAKKSGGAKRHDTDSESASSSSGSSSGSSSDSSDSSDDEGGEKHDVKGRKAGGR